MAQVPNLDPSLSAINPSSEQAAIYLGADQSQPVVFVNLHEYYDRARYEPDYDGAGGPANVSGIVAYHRYLDALEHEFHQRVGGKMMISAPNDLTIVGSGPWHEVVITYYPTRAAAMELAAVPAYAAATVHRIAGLKSVMTLVLGKQALDHWPGLR